MSDNSMFNDRSPRLKPKKPNDDEEEDVQQLESNISKALSDQITKVVVILVLLMLFLLPVLKTDTYLE